MKALLVIDVQKALFKKGKGIYRGSELLANLNHLIRQAESQGAPVVLVRHCNDSFLMEGAPDWQVHDDLQLPASMIVINKRHGSCFEDTGLYQELKLRGIKAVVVTGLVTQGCVRASSLAALQLGYAVTLVSDGHSSYNKDAAALIEQWNRQIEAAGAILEKATEVSFE